MYSGKQALGKAFLGELVFHPSPQEEGRDEKRAPLKTPVWEARLRPVVPEVAMILKVERDRGE